MICKDQKTFWQKAKAFKDFSNDQNSSEITDDVHYLQNRLDYFIAVSIQKYLPSIVNKLINIERKMLRIVFSKEIQWVRYWI